MDFLNDIGVRPNTLSWMVDLGHNFFPPVPSFQFLLLSSTPPKLQNPIPQITLVKLSCSGLFIMVSGNEVSRSGETDVPATNGMNSTNHHVSLS